MNLGIARFLMSFVLFAAAVAHAQSYPAKPVRIVVGFSAGGSIDIVGRRLAQKLGESFRQQFIIDNRVGAGSIIGTDHVAKAAPDGYTLSLSGVTGLAAGASVFKASGMPLL